MIDRDCKFQIDFVESGWNYRLVIIPAEMYGTPPTVTKTLSKLAVRNLSEIASKFADDKLPVGLVASDSTKFIFNMRYVTPDLYNILINPVLTSAVIPDYIGAIRLTNVFQLWCDFGTGTLSQIFIGAQKPTLVNKLKITMESMICEIEVNNLAQTVLETIKPIWIITDFYTYMLTTANNVHGKPNYIGAYRTIELAWTESGQKRIIFQDLATYDNAHFDSCNIFVNMGAFEVVLQNRIRQIAGMFCRTTDTTGLVVNFQNEAYLVNVQEPDSYLTTVNSAHSIYYKNTYFIGWHVSTTYYDDDTNTQYFKGLASTPPTPTNDGLRYGSSWDFNTWTELQRGGFFAKVKIKDNFGLIDYNNLWDFFKELAESNYSKLLFNPNQTNAPFGIQFLPIKTPYTTSSNSPLGVDLQTIKLSELSSIELDLGENQIRSCKASLRGVNDIDKKDFEYDNIGSLAEFDEEYKPIFHNLPLGINYYYQDSYITLHNDVIKSGIGTITNNEPFSNTKLYHMPSNVIWTYYYYPIAIHPIQTIDDGVQYYTDNADGKLSDIPAVVFTAWNPSLDNIVQWLQENLNSIVHQCRVIANTFSYHDVKNQSIFESEFTFDNFYGVVGDVFTFDNDATWLPYWEEINKLFDGEEAQGTFYFLPTRCILMDKTTDVKARKYKCKFMLFQDQYSETQCQQQPPSK